MAWEIVRAPTSYGCGLPEAIKKHKHVSVPSRGEYAMSQELYEKACVQNKDMSLQVFAET